MAELQRLSESADPEIRLWFHELDRGIARRKQETPLWRKIDRFRDGQHWPGQKPNEEPVGDRVTVNKIGAWVQSRLAAITFKTPGASVRPVRDEDAGPVEIIDPMTGEVTRPFGDTPQHVIAENLLNFVIGQPTFGLYPTARRFAMHGLCQYGTLKTGYFPTFEDVPGEDEQVIPMAEDGIPDYSGYEMDPQTGMPLRDEDGRLVKTGAGPTSELFFCDCVSPYKMVIDPDGGPDFRQHAWVAMEIERTLADVKADRTLKNTKDLKATGARGVVDSGDDDEDPKLSLEVFEDRVPDESIREHCETVRLFEIFDMRKRRIIVLAEGHAKYLRDEPTPPEIDLAPFSFFRPVERTDEFYPRPPAADLIPLNEEYNWHCTQQLTFARHMDRVVLRDPNRFGNEQVMKLKAVGDMRVIDVPGLGQDGAPVQIVPMPSVGGEAFLRAAQCQRDIDEVGRQPGEARGMSTANTATQVNTLTSYSRSGEDDLRNMLGYALKQMLKQLLDSLQRNMRLPVAVAIEGRDGQMFRGLVTRDMIQGDFDVSVDVVEMAPRNTDVERQQLQAMLQTLGNTTPPYALFRKPAVADMILRMWDIRDKTVRDALVELANEFAAQPAAAPGAAPTGAPADVGQMLAQMGGAAGPMAGGG
jgi:hypothetical protein